MNETMIERVARALFVSSMNHEGMNATNAAWDMAVSAGGATHELEGFRVMARAAIEALREPTEEMEHAGFEPMCAATWIDTGKPYWNAEGPGQVWAAMLDAALSPNKEPKA